MLALATGTFACETNLRPWGGPAHTLYPDRIGTGEPAIQLRNEASFGNGEAMDCRTRK
jgi:hypothetical protein